MDIRRAVLLTAAVLASSAVVVLDAKYIHADPSGKPHPGCITSNPEWVGYSRHSMRPDPNALSANRTCPGNPMTEVWDYESEIYPFNLKLANDAFDAFFADNAYTASNDYNTPTFSDFVEPKDPPRQLHPIETKHYTRHGHRYWKYEFPWTNGVVTNSTGGFNVDIAQEYCNMTVVKELRQLDAYLAEHDSSAIVRPDLELDSAVRDDFDKFMRLRRRNRWKWGRIVFLFHPIHTHTHTHTHICRYINFPLA